MRKRAFTLVELMMVIAIIVILTALLLPAVVRTKETGRSAVCLQYLHQIGIGLQQYVLDDQNLLPRMFDQSTNRALPSPGPAINTVLLPYIVNPNVFRCPSDREQLFELTGSSYSWNALLNGQDADHLQMLTNGYPLHEIFLVLDKQKFHLTRGQTRAINYLYADGHIKNMMELQMPQ
jgi:prepilin-type N-terminal cleavage/methylation domain-containing protein/prepilin-type processing-associated H-X9-DG protein